MSQEKPTLKPGYFNKLPLLKAVANIKSTIGLQDSCIQTNQAAVLYLEKQAKLDANPEQFVKDVCGEFKISIGTSDLDYFKKIQFKSYILQTYNLVEPFFKQLNDNYRFYNNFSGAWKNKDKDDKPIDPFNQLLENTTSEKKRIIKSYPEYYLLDYYRLIRNSIVHLQEDENEHKKTTKYFKTNIEPRLAHFKLNYEIDAPNEPDNIYFYDFMLYTRAIKYFSNVLNDICFPDLETLVSVAKDDVILQKKLKESSVITSERILLKRISALRWFFHFHFNTAYKELRDDFCRAYLRNQGIDYSRYL